MKRSVPDTAETADRAGDGRMTVGATPAVPAAGALRPVDAGPPQGAIARRKLRHFAVCVKMDVDHSPPTNGFEGPRPPYSAPPEVDLAPVDLTTRFFGAT